MSGRNTQHITKLSRRAIIIGAAAAGGYVLYHRLRPKAGSSLSFASDDNSKRGHPVREQFIPGEVASTELTDVVIVGGGVSGLSAAYHLEKKQFNRYMILEADEKLGGNSASGKNDIGRYPLGAHYLPIARNDDRELLSFLQEIGVISGFKDGHPLYREEYLCSAPHERLFIKGRWQSESVIPQFAASETELAEMKSFLDHTEGLRSRRGRDGKYVFSIPLERSSQDPDWLKLDEISFADYLEQKNWRSEYLKWYVDYCCRDDFGITAEHTSAWAGLHYFASRNGVAANAESQSVLTWPEGNGFLVDRLSEKLTGQVKLKATVRMIRKKGSEFEIFYSDEAMRTRLVRAKKLVMAVTKPVIERLLPDVKFPHKARFQPWLLTNIKIKREALEDKIPLCWDNVRFGTDSLGYINSSHQHLAVGSDDVNITFYHTFAGSDDSSARRLFAELTDADLWELTRDELRKMHSEFDGAVSRVEFKKIGHGMVGPDVGYLWNRRLKNLAAEPKDIVFAHTERAGISIFEEAFHQGRAAADRLTIST